MKNANSAVTPPDLTLLKFVSLLNLLNSSVEHTVSTTFFVPLRAIGAPNKNNIKSKLDNDSSKILTQNFH